MNLPKAIEILEDLTTTLPQFSPDDRREAVMLGIASLQRQIKAREYLAFYQPTPLDGETLPSPQENTSGRGFAPGEGK